jgi:hypothetical protein
LAVSVESDQLVLDYLSRVGDLAQTTLPAAQRMQLVARLRSNIDRERSGSDSAAAVRRILGKIGTPDEVVEAAADATSGGARRSAAGPEPVEPLPGSYGPYSSYSKPKAPPRPRRSADAEVDGERDGEDVAGTAFRRRGRPGRDEDDAPDWWSMRPGAGGGRVRAGDELAGLPGMTGGVFIPFDDEELAEKDVPPRRRLPVSGEEELYEKESAEGVPETEEVAVPAARRRLLPRLPGTRRAGGRGWGSPVLLLAAALLVAGAAIGSFVPLGLGWLAGYLSRTLTRPQAKFAVLGIPGLAALGLLIWLWGRDAGKWSTPILKGQLDQAILDGLPVAIRCAAIASALYFLWRARRTAS